ncbi:metallophosphoesterase [Paenibacillus oenotherae]|uniref:Metallophosphoesterase n=2 Tax=Paenibacillus oenotherae TaxID=1435645 RepID=A0ABS7D8H0_9BACL|nr:metallophosphoesterase [Paenibacillus oenotherae]
MRAVRMIASTVFFVVLILGLQYYVGWHLKLFLQTWFDGVPGVMYWICFWIIAMSYLVSRLLERAVKGRIARGLKWVGSYWFAILQYSVLLLPIADLAAWVLHLSAVPMETIILATGSTVILILLAILTRGSWNAWKPITRQYTIEVPKTAGAVKELRIAVASDLHLGTIVGRSYLRLLVNRVNAIEPDLVLLPGDVIDDDIEPFKRLQYGSLLSGLKSRYGTYAVLGNHEYFGGHIEEFVALMKQAGIAVLLDESVAIADSFYIIGRKDKTAQRLPGGRLPIGELTAGLDHSMPLILMDHQPSALQEAADNGIDLSLHGHTHRGQMAPNHWITRRIFELDWGYLRKGNLHAFVSSGYGSWGPPIRIGSRSEILDITIRFVSQQGS